MLISAAKTKISIALFLPLVLMCQKRQISLPVGYKTATPRRLGTIVTSIQDSKPREKQISQSFSYCELINLLRNSTIVRCLWENKKTSEKCFSRGLKSWIDVTIVPNPLFLGSRFCTNRKWNLMLLVQQNTGKENRYGENLFCCTNQYIGEIWSSKLKKNMSYTLKVCHGFLIRCCLNMSQLSKYGSTWPN